VMHTGLAWENLKEMGHFDGPRSRYENIVKMDRRCGQTACD
jgi:hypothetical protein